MTLMEEINTGEILKLMPFRLYYCATYKMYSIMFAATIVPLVLAILLLTRIPAPRFKKHEMYLH
jgi:hypothetical protein